MRLLKTTEAPIIETRYYIRDHRADAVSEEQGNRQGLFDLVIYDHRPDERWLILNLGPYSMQVTPESIKDTSEHGWTAQVGTKPVKVDGIWGGRNYPNLFVPAKTMRVVWEQLT